MRRTSFYPGGPELGRQDVTPAEEVAECRRILGPVRWPATVDGLGPEQYDSHEEYLAALDRERWGDDPFGED